MLNDLMVHYQERILAPNGHYYFVTNCLMSMEDASKLFDEYQWESLFNNPGQWDDNGVADMREVGLSQETPLQNRFVHFIAKGNVDSSEYEDLANIKRHPFLMEDIRIGLVEGVGMDTDRITYC
jgi:hypothetical protein